MVDPFFMPTWPRHLVASPEYHKLTNAEMAIYLTWYKSRATLKEKIQEEDLWRVHNFKYHGSSMEDTGGIAT